MNRNWLHPSRPNVPQPPFNLTPDVAPVRQNPRARANSAATSPVSAEMRRENEPEVPRRPSGYASPHHNGYISGGGTRPAVAQPPVEPLPETPAPTNSAPSTGLGGLRRMTPEDRAAYIREVDARQTAMRAGGGEQGGAGQATGRQPQQLAQASLQMRQDGSGDTTATTASAPSERVATPPTDDAALQAYLAELYAQDRSGQVVVPPQATASSSSALMPDDQGLADAMATASTGSATYAETAHPPADFRKPATAIYNADGTPYGHQRQASVTVTPAAPGAAVGPVTYDAANNAIVEVFSNGQVVARISLPYPGAR